MSYVLVPRHPFKISPSRELIELLQQVFRVYYLVLAYLLSSCPMLSVTLFEFKMLYHIVVRRNLQLNLHIKGKIISKISRVLVVVSMSDLQVFVAINLETITDKVFFLGMLLILTVFLLGMMKVRIK